MYDIRKHIGQIPYEILEIFHQYRDNDNGDYIRVQNEIYNAIWDSVGNPFETAAAGRLWHQIK